MTDQRMKLVILTGAGISAESGITTFRDSGGLWEQYDVMQVASIDGWNKDPRLMLKFYNERRHQLEKVNPNSAHIALVELEKKFQVEIITQNVDNLHERAGSSKVLHLHGELTKVRSSNDAHLIYDIGYRSIEWGEKADDGSQLRPHIVWFGETVPMMDQAILKVTTADLLIIIGTSLNVYPAASLVEYANSSTPIYLIDPNHVSCQNNRKISIIKEKATTGMELMKTILYN